MEIIDLKQNSTLHTTEDVTGTLELVTSGKVEICTGDQKIRAGRGTILGLLEFPGENYSFSYTADSDCRLEQFPYEKRSDVDRIIKSGSVEPDVIVGANANIALSLLNSYKRSFRKNEKVQKLITGGYDTYRKLCKANGFEIQSWPLAEEFEPFTPEEELPDWLGDYYDQLGLMPADIKRSYYSTHTSLTTAAIMEAADHIQLILRLTDALNSYSSNLRDSYNSSVTLFDLYLNLRLHCEAAREITDQIDATVTEYDKQISSTGLLSEKELNDQRMLYSNASTGNQNASLPPETKAIPPIKDTEISQEITPAKENAFDPYKRIRDSLNVILEFAQIEGEDAERIGNNIAGYRALKDKNSSEKEVKELRSAIKEDFFMVYEAATLAALKMTRKPPEIVRLFLYFGYMDEGLMGVDNTLQLLKLADMLESDGHRDLNVFTAFDWLKMIYEGDREPSRNEYDQDYATYLRARKQSGEISEKEENELLFSPEDRLHFEIDNFFKAAMGIGGGRSSYFCPALSAHSFVRSPETTYISGRKVAKNWIAIKDTDFSLFYRECLYKNEAYKINRDIVLIETMPETILLPLVGKLGGLWQEISGVNRDSAARMFLPIFSGEDLSLMQLRLAGEFRWAICKKIQGARWNNITVPSLTSYYYDYLQFYRKNKEISSASKEKLRSQIHSCRNSFENVFVLDYIQWIRFESKGIPRLNRAARQIMGTFCPFSKAIRDNLGGHPMYSEMVRRYEHSAAEKCRALENKYAKNKDPEGTLPGLITSFINFYRL